MVAIIRSLKSSQPPPLQAVATVEVIERTPAALRDAILRAVGDAYRILFAPPHDLPATCSATSRPIRGCRSNATPDEMVNSPAGVTEAFAAVARTGSVCVDVGYERPEW